MKILEELRMLGANKASPRNTYSIRLQRSLYALKQSRRMCYNHLSEYLIKAGYVNNPICLCVCTKNVRIRIYHCGNVYR